MKKYTSITTAFILSFIVMTTIQGCNKYENGPLMSLRTRKERMANTWIIENYKKNGKDLTSYYNGYLETFTKNGDYSYVWENISGTGEWSFDGNDQDIKIVGALNQSNQTITLLKLEEKRMWYYYMDGDDKKEFHMKAN